MLNNNYQHLFDMIPIIFNDRLQSSLKTSQESRTISWGIKSHSCHNFDFNWFTESEGVL